MKLLREFVSHDDIQVITESDENTTDKRYYLKGPFLQASVKNRNGRVYKRDTLIREVKEFCDHKISNNRGLGELSHPESIDLNLDRVSHLITELRMEGDIGYGVAKLLDTPMGQIAKALVKDGVQVGMSTRGVGTLEGDSVGDDYKLITVDIVADPSAPTAFVEGVLENKEWIISNTGEIVEAAVQQLKKNVDKAVRTNRYDRNEFSKQSLSYLDQFLKSIR